MRGHIEIERMRLEGCLPEWVFVNDYPCKTDWFETGSHATVCTHNDAIGGMDLRFLAGSKVSISSESESRAKRLFARVKEAGAVVVAACHLKAGKKLYEQDGWYEIYKQEEPDQ